jgi:hypothetical protein
MADDKHEKALDLTEAALDKLAKGDKQAAGKLIDQAKQLDETAPAEVVRDLDEDAASRA